MEKENVLLDKSLLFAARIIKLNKYLTKEKHETIISKQIVRSATSIGANANEGVYGVSKADFIAKLQISLSEMNKIKKRINEELTKMGYNVSFNDELLPKSYRK